MKPRSKQKGIRLIPIGHRDFVQSGAIVGVLRHDSPRVKKLTDTAVQTGMLINATGGRRPVSIILLKSRHIVLSALQPEIIKSRLKESSNPIE